MVTLKCVLDAKSLRTNYPELDIIAGNVAIAAAARDLFEAGADVLKLVFDQDQSVLHV